MEQAMVLKTTRITVETDTLMVVSRARAISAWCPDCRAEVDAIALGSDSLAEAATASQVQQWLDSDKLHCWQHADGPAQICVPSLLQCIGSEGVRTCPSSHPNPLSQLRRKSMKLTRSIANLFRLSGFALMLALFAALTACGPGNGTSEGGAPPGSRHVSVSGADLLLNGKKWVPRGVQFLGLLSPTSMPTACASNTGPAYMHLGQAGLDAAHTWDADVVRYQVSQYALNPANASGGPAGYSPEYLARVQQTVALARQSGFVVIVSMQHEFCSGDPYDHAMPTVDTKQAWDTIAPLWANDDGVILELFNEPELPANDANWAVWQNGGASEKKDNQRPPNTTPETAIGHQDLIDEVRSLGSKNVLIVDGMDFAKELDGMPQLNDPMSSLVFAAHPFFGSAATPDEDSSTWPTNFGDLSKNVPVFVTAWNTSNGKCELYYPDLAKTLLKYLNDNQIGLVAIDFDVLGTIVSDFNGTPNYFDSGWSCPPDPPGGTTTTGEGPGQLVCQEYRAAKGDLTDPCGPSHQ
jgi:thiol-disulfide isomerase/thioredoxin